MRDSAQDWEPKTERLTADVRIADGAEGGVAAVVGVAVVGSGAVAAAAAAVDQSGVHHLLTTDDPPGQFLAQSHYHYWLH